MASAVSSRTARFHLPLLFTLFSISILTACGGGGANSSEEANGSSASSNTYQFTADFINLIPIASSQLDTKVDLFYKHTGIDEVEIASNIDYLAQQRTSKFGWTGLSQANLTFIVKDSLNNQSSLSTNIMGYNNTQKDVFLLATGERPSTQAVSITRVNKLEGETNSYRLFHANALDPRKIDIYNANAQTAIVLNLAFNQISAPIKYDQSLAEINIFAIPSGTMPDYSNTSNYLFQAVITQESNDTLSVLVAKPGTTSSWQINHYSE
ncbi:hypothetical protein FM038_007470 [Shewanella eurypsychrophilus]|uniref:Lipoprotein n=1 Tax=Shewanella eurypsychrophilus TaxID=2593656 RepID=A0ABX6V3T2_9GAMM|nr:MULTISPECIES: hypothetical protein [Shewanella]QFU22004.1 hypothetical protein FS418_09050 [Shewanella sp. YLB-09]QPG57293.1 hypothetical protein FM038_007470 [Shewanella eurypsychrophilus]